MWIVWFDFGLFNDGTYLTFKSIFHKASGVRVHNSIIRVGRENLRITY